MDHDLSLLDRYLEQGDAQAFQQLVSAHSAMVFAVAWRVTRDEALAEEVAQDTFLALARRGDRIRQSVAAWLHHVAWQKAANGLRGKLRRARHEREAVESQQGRESGWSEIEPVVDEVLAELPPEKRGLLVEHFLEQRTQAEIARRRGVSQATVSRQIDAGLRQMRDGLRSKGVTCSLGLISLLEANAAMAVSASLSVSLGKLTLSGVGRASKLGTMSGGQLALLSWKKLALASLVVVGAGLAAFDLASPNSLLMKWLGLDGGATEVGAMADSKVADSRKVIHSNNAKRWAEEAGEIWSKAPRAGMQDVYEVMVYDGAFRDVTAHFNKLQAIGVRLSRATFDQLKGRFDQANLNRSINQRVDFDDWWEVIRAWVKEQPREAVAWAYHITAEVDEMRFAQEPGWLKAGWTLPFAVEYMKQNPEAWTAFITAAPDPKLGEYARVWLEEADDPGSIWSWLADIGLPASEFGGVAERKVRDDPPSQASQFLLRCPDKTMVNRYLPRLVPRLDDESLGKWVRSGIEVEAGLGKLLRALSGDSSVSFAEVLAWLRAQEKNEEFYALDSAAVQQCMDKIHAKWMCTDPEACLKLAMTGSDKKQLESVMAQAAQIGMDVTAVFDCLAAAKTEKRDEALGIYYRALATNDPEECLRLIASSGVIEDQIRAAKPVLKIWAEVNPSAACEWLESLSVGAEQAELAAALVSGWMGERPHAAKEAVAFAKKHGARLADYSGALAFSIRSEKEALIAEVLRPLRDEQGYNLLVVRTGAYGMGTHMSLQFMARQGGEGWQESLVDEVIRWFKVGDCRADEYALMLPSQDLKRVPAAKVVKVAEELTVQLHAEGKLQHALDWLLRLPAPAGAAARAAALARLEKSDEASRSRIRLWVKSATMTEAEREELLKMVEISEKPGL